MRHKKKMISCLAALMLIGLAGCSTAIDAIKDMVVEEETLPTVTNLYADELALVVNGVATANLHATADAEGLPEGAQIVFIYTASNDSISVDTEGNITAVSATTITPFVTVTAKYDADGDGVADSEISLATKKVQISVSVNIEAIALSQDSALIEIHPYTGAQSDVIALETTILPAGASTQITYSSSDESVATVAQDGTVTVVSTGNATITSTSEEGYTDTCEITISYLEVGAQDYTEEIAMYMLEKVNALRASVGVSALTYDYALQTTAQVRASEIYTSRYFSHTRPDGSTCFTAFPGYSKQGENLAYIANSGSYTIYDVIDRMFNNLCASSGHYAAMVNPNYNSFGTSLYGDSSYFSLQQSFGYNAAIG